MIALLPAAALALATALAPPTDPAPAATWATKPVAATAARPAPGAGFAPLDRSLIAADARWIAHVEIERFVQGRIFELLQEHEADFDVNGGDWQEVRDTLGFDPLEEIRSVTVVGLPRSEESAVAMIRGSSAVEDAMGRLEEHLSRRDLEVDGYDITRWSETGGDPVHTYLARRAGSDERLLLAASHPADLAEAISALRGDSDSLADVSDGLDTTLDSDAYVLVSVSGTLAQWADGEEASQIGRIVEKARVQLAERDGRIVLDAAIDAKNSEKVRQVTAILQGLLAFASLASAAEPELAEVMPLLDNLKFSSDGRRLSLHFEEDIDTLVQMAEGQRGGEHHDDDHHGDHHERERPTPKEGREWY